MEGRTEKEVRDMNFYEVIEKRRTIRKFKGPANEEQLRKIIRAGTLAPSPGNRQTWEFVIVDDPGLIEKMSERKYILNRGNKPRNEPVSPEKEKVGKTQKDSFANASLVLVYHKPGWAEVAAAWTCIENMSLAAAAEGLGSRIACYFDGSDKDINQWVQAPPNYELAAALSIGIPAEEPQSRSLRPEGSWLHRNRF
jgi:nitroreductase